MTTRSFRGAVTAVVVAATSIVCFAACSPSSDDKSQASTIASNVTLTADQRQHIRLYTVSASSFHKTIEATGAVDFDNDQATSVLAPISGSVSRLLVSKGQHVVKGQPLAEVDSPDFATAVSTYRAAVSTAQTDRRLADMDKDLLAHQGVAQREESQAQTDAITAEANREAARQALVALGVDPRKAGTTSGGRMASRFKGIIRAPISGTVVEKLITPGELLQAGTTACFTVADLSRVWVLAQIYDSDFESVRVGDLAKIATGTGSAPLSGTVDNISALVNPDTRSVVARVVVRNPADLLKKQMYVRVTIESHQQSNGLLVPVSAILRDDENLPFVYAEQRDHSFARRHVTLGARTDDQYDIPDGLKSGDRVVVDGGIFVQFMQSQ
ncbi:MAG TPA: efflux RND transporter periplasmic adaptor subunit [Rhizomicrobium sp.]